MLSESGGGGADSKPASHLSACPPHASAEQRIAWLETQNRQLRADLAVWQKSSLGFAREMRELLTD